MHAIVMLNMGKKQITVRIPSELMDYLDAKIDDRTFANISHAIEVCILRYKESEEKEKKV